MEFYPSIKKKKIMSFAGKWMELEIILLSEISHTQKDKFGGRGTCESKRGNS
jgi:hypothetical protein